MSSIDWSRSGIQYTKDWMREHEYNQARFCKEGGIQPSSLSSALRGNQDHLGNPTWRGMIKVMRISKREFEDIIAGVPLNVAKESRAEYVTTAGTADPDIHEFMRWFAALPRPKQQFYIDAMKGAKLVEAAEAEAKH